MDEPLSPKTATGGPFTSPHIVRNSHAIARELCAVLQQQMDTLTQCSLDDYFSPKGLSAYRLREKRLRELRSELGDFKLWAS